MLALLSPSDRPARIGDVAFRNSQEALSQTIKAICGDDLLEALARMNEVPASLPPEVEQMLTNAKEHDRRALAAALNRYVNILGCAGKFISSQQRIANALLGTGPTPPLHPGALATQVFGASRPDAFEIRGMRLHYGR